MIKIVEYPSVIQTPCLPVECHKEDGFAALAPVCLEMIQWVQERNGLGLAAPQIGDFRTYFVVNFGPKPLICINPYGILEVEGYGYTKNQEGCYSVLGKMFEVKRAKRIHAQWFDLLGKKQDVILTGMLAIIWQHEYSHLLGKCICDEGKEVTRK